MATESRVDATDPSWFPLFLKELESTHPDVYQEVTSAVIIRNAVRQVAAAAAAETRPGVDHD